MLCGLEAADIKLLEAIHEHGEWVRDATHVHSVLSGSMREVAKVAALSLGAVHKAKQRLVGKGLLRHEQGAFTASWSRVWALEPATDQPGAATPTDGERSRSRSRSRLCSRAPRTKKEISFYPPKPNAKPTSELSELQEALERATRPQTMREVLSGGDQAEAERQQAAQIDRLAGRILTAVRQVEVRHGVDPADVLDFPMAKRIAEALADEFDGGKVQQMRGILDSLRRKELFDRSPAAYLVACAKKRHWLK